MHSSNPAQDAAPIRTAGVPRRPAAVGARRVAPTRLAPTRLAPTRRRRVLPLLLTLVLVGAAPLLAGCLERSTTVGDRYSGTVIVATSPDNPRGAPQLDLPESMIGQVSVTDYEETANPEGDEESGRSGAGQDDEGQVTRVGTRATFTDLTAGQFGQLGDIVADAYGETSLTMDLTVNRSDDVVRFRGDTDLSDLTRDRDHVQLTVTFGGPVTATNGDQVGESTVTWTPQPGEPTDFSADATYPDPATAAVGSWSWFVALLCLAVVLIVARIAYTKRYLGPRPGRPVAVKTAPTTISGEGLAAAAEPTDSGTGPRTDQTVPDSR